MYLEKLRGFFLYKIKSKYIFIALVILFLLFIMLFTVGRTFTAHTFHVLASKAYYHFPSEQTEYFWQYSIDNLGFRAYVESIGGEDIRTADSPRNYVKSLSENFSGIYSVTQKNQINYETVETPEVIESMDNNIIESQSYTRNGVTGRKVKISNTVTITSKSSEKSKESDFNTVDKIDAKPIMKVTGAREVNEVKNSISEHINENINNDHNSIKSIEFYTSSPIVINPNETQFKAGEVQILFNSCNIYISIPIFYEIEVSEYYVGETDIIGNYSCEGISGYDQPVEIATCDDCALYNVDKLNRLPSSFEPDTEIIELEGENVVTIDKRLVSDFKNMYRTAREAGHDVNITSSYRSFETQVEVFEYWVLWNQRVYGYSREQALEAANNVSAIPGFSEHQLGTTVDLNAKQCESFEGFCVPNEELWKWLRENAHKFGFVLSYPDNRIDETGYKFEPWHYRWIGRTNAKDFVSDSNLLTLNNWLGKRE